MRAAVFSIHQICFVIFLVNEKYDRSKLVSKVRYVHYIILLRYKVVICYCFNLATVH